MSMTASDKLTAELDAPRKCEAASSPCRSNCHVEHTRPCMSPVFRSLRTFILYPLSFILLSLLGCSSSSEDSQTLHLSLWHGFTAEETVVLRELVAEYERTHAAPDGRPVRINVEYVSYNDMFVKLKTAALGRITPDIAFMD